MRRPGRTGARSAATTIIIAVLGCAGLAACSSSPSSSSPSSTSSSSSAAGLTKVRVGANLTVGSLPIYVGIDEGFFAKHHLSVSLTNVLNLTLIPSELGKQFDFGQSVQPIVIHAADSGLPVTVTGGGEVESPNYVDAGVIVKKSSGITSAKDLVGKRVAVLTETGNNAYALEYWMKNQGVNPNSVTFTVVTANNMLAELAAGEVDAIYSIAPFTLQDLQNPAYTMLVNPQLDLGAKVSQGTITISNKTWAASHQQVVLEFEEAEADAIAWTEAHPAQALTILDKYTGAKNAPGTKLPSLTATENTQDLQVWFKVLKSVIPGFTTTLTPASLLDEPLNNISYTPQP